MRASAHEALDAGHARARQQPFRYVHDDELYYRAHREWWTKKMPERLFPSVEVEVARLRRLRGRAPPRLRRRRVRRAWDPQHPQCVVLCEPSGETPDSLPSVQPEGYVHLVGLGRPVIDPRDGAKKAVGGACTFGTTVEMLLLEMRVPYVLHALDPDAKAAWYGRCSRRPSRRRCTWAGACGCRRRRTS